MLDNFIQKLKYKSFYYRLIVTFAVISIIAVIISTVISWYILGKRYNLEIQNSNLQILRQVQIYVDKNLYTDAFDIINQYFIEGSSQSPLVRFFEEDASLTLSEYSLCFRDLSAIRSKNQNVSGVFIYNRKEDVFIDSSLGLSLDSSEKSNLSYKYHSFQLYQGSIMSDSKVYIAGGQNGLTIMRSLPFYRSFEDCAGYVACSMDVERIMQTPYSIMPHSSVLLILDKDGRVLTEKASDKTTVDIDSLRAYLSGGEAINTFRHSGTLYALTSIRSTESGWQYVSYMPLDSLMSKSVAAGQRMILLSALVLLCVIILTRFAALIIYKPLGLLAVKANKEGGGTKSELTVISDALVFLEERVDDMQATLMKNRNLLEHKLVSDILNQSHMLANNDIIKRLSLTGISFTKPFVCVLAIEFEGGSYNSLSYSQREYILAMAPEAFASWSEGKISFATASLPMNRVAFILNVDEKSFGDLTDKKHELVVYLKEHLHISLNAALSEMLAELRHISAVYPDVLKSFDYSMIYRYGHAFDHLLIRKFEATGLDITDNDYSRFETYILNDSYEYAMEWLMHFRNQVFEKQCSYKSVNEFILQAYNIVIRIARKRNLFHDNAKKEEARKQFEDARIFDESVECVRDMLDMIITAEPDDNSNITVINEIKDYINAHCEEEISLSSIAETFKLSSSHLSRLFKRVAEENISVYIVNAKLEKAAFLLISDPERSVSDIANTLGYFSPAYFRRLFKDKFGVTPSEYRKR